METKEFKRYLRENIKKPKYENVEIKQPPIEEKIERFDWLSGGIQCFVTVLNFSVVSFVLLKDINTTLLCAAVSAIGTFLVLSLPILLKEEEQINPILLIRKCIVHI